MQSLLVHFSSVGWFQIGVLAISCIVQKTVTTTQMHVDMLKAFANGHCLTREERLIERLLLFSTSAYLPWCFTINVGDLHLLSFDLPLEQKSNEHNSGLLENKRQKRSPVLALQIFLWNKFSAKAEQIFVSLCLFLIQKVPSHGLDLQQLETGLADGPQATRLLTKAVEINEKRKDIWNLFYTSIVPSVSCWWIFVDVKVDGWQWAFFYGGVSWCWCHKVHKRFDISWIFIFQLQCNHLNLLGNPAVNEFSSWERKNYY